MCPRTSRLPMPRILFRDLKRSGRRTRSKSRSRSLLLERLENRQLLAVGTWQVKLSGTGGIDLFGPTSGAEVQIAFRGNGIGRGRPVDTGNVPGVNNVAPTAVADDFSATPVDEDSILNILAAGLLANDTDAENDALHVVAENVASALGAAVAVNADGSFSYDPRGSANLQALATGSNTNDTFQYTLQDARGGTSLGTATIVVTGLNDAPIARNDNLTTNEDALINGDVTADNGSGADSDPDSAMSVTRINGAAFDAGTPITLASGALLTMNGNGTFHYDPNGKFDGLALGDRQADAFTYTIDDGQGQANSTDTATVTLTINGLNDQPLAADDAITSSEDTAVSGNVLLDNGAGADVDPDDSDTLQVTRINGAAFTPGTPLTLGSGALLTFNTNGTFDYDPNGQFEDLAIGESSVEQFSYTIDDGRGQGNSTTSATVTITIQGRNDAPLAADDALTTSEDTLVSGNVLLNNGAGADVDPDDSDTLQVTRINGAAFTPGTPLTLGSGALLTFNTNGTFDYDPNGQFEDLAIGESSVEQFSYTIDDGRGQGNSTTSATVTITIQGRNDAPLAADDAITTSEDTLVSGNVLLNNGAGADVDPDDSDTLQVTRINGAAFTPGTPLTLGSGALLTFNTNGTFDYDPNGQFEDLAIGEFSVEQFSYTIDDGRGQANSTDQGNVTVTITGGNDQPIAQDDAISVSEDGVLTGANVLADNGSGADSDPDASDTLSVTRINGSVFTPGTPITLGSDALLTFNTNGTFNYDPNGRYEDLAIGELSVEQFSYTIDDGRGQANSTTSATATITIQGRNEAPLAADDAITTSEDTLVSGNVLLNNGAGADV